MRLVHRTLIQMCVCMHIAVVFQVSCGRESSDWINTPVSPEIETPPVEREEPERSLKPYIDAFLHDCGEVYGADVSNINKLRSVKYDEVATEDNPNRVGVCYTWIYDHSGELAYADVVVVKPKTYELWFKALMYHELAHCILLVGHTPQEPQSMMSPVMAKNEFYEENWDGLVEEMCTLDPADTVQGG